MLPSDKQIETSQHRLNVLLARGLDVVATIKDGMNEVDALLQQYERAVELNTGDCSHNPSIWHRPDTNEFTALRALLIPLAEAGEMRCQYALATIYWLGFCCDSEEEYHRNYEETIQIATRWWIAAASQGHWGALDNLITCGVGVEADRVKEACRQFEEQNKHLVGWSHNMPVYGPDFMQAVCKTIYGRVAED